MILCSGCGKELPASSYYVNKARRNGLTSQCKDCIRSSRREAGTSAKRADQLRRYKAKYPERRKADKQLRRKRSRLASGAFTGEDWLARLSYHENRCYYCGCGGPMTIEHRIPLSRGGTNWPSNLVPACADCNNSKGTLTEKEYKAKQCLTN